MDYEYFERMYHSDGRYDVNLVWHDPDNGARVYLGAEKAIHSEFCEMAHIDLIINVNSQTEQSDGPQPYCAPDPAHRSDKHKWFPFHDDVPSKQEKGMKDNAGHAVMTLVEAIQSGKNVAIHCRAGIHRSAAVVYAALTILGHFPDRYEAYKHVTKHRPQARMYNKLARWVYYAGLDEKRYREEG